MNNKSDLRAAAVDVLLCRPGASQFDRLASARSILDLLVRIEEAEADALAFEAQALGAKEIAQRARAEERKTEAAAAAMYEFCARVILGDPESVDDIRSGASKCLALIIPGYQESKLARWNPPVRLPEAPATYLTGHYSTVLDSDDDGQEAIWNGEQWLARDGLPLRNQNMFWRPMENHSDSVSECRSL